MKKERIIGIIIISLIGLLLIFKGVLYIISEKDTIKGEKYRVEVDKKNRTLEIHTGAVSFNTRAKTEADSDDKVIVDENSPARGIFGKYNFNNILNGEDIKDIDYNGEKRLDKLLMDLYIQPFNQEADKKLKKVDITLELKARCDLKDYRKYLDVSFVRKDEGDKANDLLERNETLKYHITDTKKLGKYTIFILDMSGKKVNWAFDVKITDRSIYDKK